MPYPGAGFPIPPFEWPHVGRQWPAYNVESDQAAGLVAWWPTLASRGAGMLQDLSGHGHRGTIHGAAGWRFDPEMGIGIWTDASAEYVQIPDHADLDGMDALTISLWLILQSGGSGFPAILDKGESAGGSYLLAVNSAAPTLYWQVYGTGAISGFVTDTITYNTLYHIALTYDSADVVIYQNGVYVKTDSDASGPVKSNAADLYFGWGSNRSNDAPFALFDPRIYNRTFTAAEVWQLYDSPTRWELHQLPRRLWQLGVPTGITIGMDTLSLTGTAQTMTQVSGAVSLAMDTLNLAGTVQALTQISGAVSLAMDTLGLTGSAQASTVSVGAVSLVMDVLDLVGAAQNLAVAPGAVTLAMDTLGLSATAQTLTVSTAIIIAMDALGLIGAAQSLAVTPGAVSLLMDALGLTGDAQSLAVAPGVVSLAMDALGLAGNAQGLSVVPGAVALAMDALNLSGAAETLTQVSGAVALVMDALNLTGSAQSLTVSTGIFIAMTLLGLTGNAQALAVVPGEVTIAMSELQAAVAALALAVLVVGGKLDVALTDAAATLLASSDAVATALATSDAAVTALAMDDETRG